MVAIVVVLAIIIGEVAADVINSGSVAARVEAQTYVAEVIPVIDQSTTLASTMHLVRDANASVARTNLEQAMGDLVEGTSANLNQLTTLGVPAPSGRSGDLLEATLAARARGSRDLVGAIALAIRSSSTQEDLIHAASGIVQAGKELVVADGDYRRFVLSLPRSSGRGRLPLSRWVLNPASWAESAARLFVTALSGSAGLRASEDLVIVALSVEPPVVRINGLPTTTTVPATTSSTTTSSTTTTTLPGATTLPTTTSTSTTTTSTSTTTTLQLPPAGSTSVLPPTTRVSVVLVIANVGNTGLSTIWAAASIVPVASTDRNGSGGQTHSIAVRVGRLGPGTSLVVTLPALAVSSGRSYTLYASIGNGSLPTGPVTAPRGAGQTDQVSIRVASG